MALFKKIINKISGIAEKAMFFIVGYPFIYFLVGAKYKRFPSSVGGHCNVATKDYFYKIAFKNSAFFFDEKNNLDLVKKKFPAIAAIIPEYQYLSYLNKKVNVMKTERLCSVPDRNENFKAAKKILNIFRGYGVNAACTIEKLPYSSDGLALVKNLYDTKIYEAVLSAVKQFLASGQFKIGPCHGDFHHKNIMKMGQDVYVVDLDCFRDAGLQALDTIYYVNQYAADDLAKPWHRVFIDILTDKKKYMEYHDFLGDFLTLNETKGYALLYCLDRLGQEAKYLTSWGIFPRKKLRDTLMYLADEKKAVAV